MMSKDLLFLLESDDLQDLSDPPQKCHTCYEGLDVCAVKCWLLGSDFSVN